MKRLSLASIHLDKMKILAEIVVALLYLNSVTPVVMYYIYDDAHKVGISSASSGPATSNFKYGLTGLQMKHFSRQVSADNARAVDSHFKVKKTSSGTYTAPPENLMISESKDKKEAPKGRIVDKKETRPEVNAKVVAGKENPNLVYFRVPIGADRVPYFEQNNQRGCRLKEGSFDTHSSLEVNVHKTQIPTVPQKVKLNSNRQLTAVSIYGPDNYHQKMPTSAVVDKTLQKKSNFAERGSQIMYRIPDDMTAQAANGIQAPGTVTMTGAKKSKRKVTYENMRKYIGKDNAADVTRAVMNNEKRLDKYANAQRRPSVETLRIGSINDITNLNNYTPYALFYRMTPEIVGRNVGEFVPFMSTLETGVAKNSKFPNKSSIKKKRLSSNYADESSASRKAYGLVKYGLHRNFREN